MTTDFQLAPGSSHTPHCLTTAAHLQWLIPSFDSLATAAHDAAARGEAVDPVLVEKTRANIGGVLTETWKLPAPWEPELLEAVARMQRCREELRELLP